MDVTVSEIAVEVSTFVWNTNITDHRLDIKDQKGSEHFDGEKSRKLVASGYMYISYMI